MSCGHRILTECSSCFTSSTVPSLNAHCTMSVSSEAPFTHSLFSNLLQNLAKSCSLIRCYVGHCQYRPTKNCLCSLPRRSSRELRSRLIRSRRWMLGWTLWFDVVEAWRWIGRSWLEGIGTRRLELKCEGRDLFAVAPVCLLRHRREVAAPAPR